MVFPGWGQTKITGKPWWLGGIAAYGTLAGGFIINKNSQTEYDSYLAEDNPDKRKNIYDKAQKKLTMANTMFISSATIWVANLIWITVSPNDSKHLKNSRVYLTPVPYNDNKGVMVSIRLDF
jgi:hypothetical protein